MATSKVTNPHPSPLPKGEGNKKITSMAELMASQGSRFEPFQKGQIVTGTVKKLTPKEILLDIHGKSDALVLEYDRTNLENLLKLLKVGDTVKASVLSAESEEGFPVVSLRRMLDDLIYETLEEAFSRGEEVMVSIQDHGRGGYFAYTPSGVRGFLPNSQLLGDEELMGKTIPVKIVELNKAAKRVIFSQKALHYVTTVSDLESEYKEGGKVKGTVNGTSSYGMYIDLPTKSGMPAEGFIHISEISHQRVESIDDKFKKGDALEAYVLGVDRENRRVNLSLKKLQADTFETVETKFPKEQKVAATVSDVKSRGITVDLGDGFSGFISSSKVSSGTEYKVGQKIEVEVVDYDKKKRLVLVSPVLTAVPISYR